MRMKNLMSRVKGGKISLKSFSDAKASQLNHYIISILEEYEYNCAIIHVGMATICGPNISPVDGIIMGQSFFVISHVQWVAYRIWYAKISNESLHLWGEVMSHRLCLKVKHFG